MFTKKALSLDEIMNGAIGPDGKRVDTGTGLSREEAQKGLRDAVKHGYLIVEGKGRQKRYRIANQIFDQIENGKERGVERGNGHKNGRVG